MSARRLLLLLLLPGATHCGSCGSTGPRYAIDPQRYRHLPSTIEELVALADAAHARPAWRSSLKEIDRGLAALEQALAKRQDAVEILWRLARGTFLMTELLPNREQRATYAAQGRDWAQRAVELAPRRVEARYYQALNVAKIAEAEHKLTLLKPMLQMAEEAAKIDPRFDDAGAYRFMGKVYITAPAWPVSVGSPDKAVALLEKAVALSPVPLNRLFLGQAYFHDEEYGKARAHLEAALARGAELDPRWRKEGESYLRRARDKSD